MNNVFDLDQYRTYAGAKVFSGRPRGEEVRRQLGLTERDSKNDITVIRIPEDVYTFNMSFFLGLCAESVATLGTEGFFNHYRFEGPESLRKDIPDYVLHALKESIPI